MTTLISDRHRFLNSWSPHPRPLPTAARGGERIDRVARARGEYRSSEDIHHVEFLRRAAPDAAVVPRLRRRRGHPVHPAELAARMGDDTGGPAAARDSRGCRDDRRPHARRAGGVRRPRARSQDRGADLRADLRGDRARRFRARRQAGAELEGLGAAAQSRAAPSAGEMVQAAARRPAVPARALPDRAARRLRPVAAVQRAGSRDADQGGARERRLGDQRAQAVHLQRLRRRALCRLRQQQPQGRDAAGHVVVPGAARDQGPDGRALQRDARLPLHEQRRAGVRGHVRAGRPSARRERRARQGRRLFPSRQDHPGARKISASACAPSR